MERNKTLVSLAVGECGILSAVCHPSPDMARRLRLLGFTAGAKVVRVGSSPGGKMGAYEVLGAVIALRDVDAEKVMLCSAPSERKGVRNNIG